MPNRSGKATRTTFGMPTQSPKPYSVPRHAVFQVKTDNQLDLQRRSIGFGLASSAIVQL